ncbi:MAG: hypothetical protein LBV16_04020 [Elusimicrobiota bacterium]|jgi:hypothetical protein|nr:hypothetical protein [Elusimicrobiota bacterium]
MIKGKNYKRLVILGLVLTFIFVLSVKILAQSKSVETTSGVKTSVQSKTAATNSIKTVAQSKNIKKGGVKANAQSKSVKASILDNKGSLLFILFAIVSMAIVFLIVYAPILIAKKRGIVGSNLTTIKVLSWISIISFSVTWWIALILALVYKRDD